MAAKKNTDQPQHWKDYVNRKSIDELAKELHHVHSQFDRKGFVDTLVTPHFLSLELKERVHLAAQTLNDFLPGNYPETARILVETGPRGNTLHNWILTSYVALFGLDHFDESVNALRELTVHGSSEFAIRPLMNRYTERMMPILHEWAQHPNEHIRRLAAEGSRPRGVWVAHIDSFKKNPAPVLKLLERLKADPSLYVRKAVANNLNDISKDHPDLVIKTALKWQKANDKATDWIIKHACRSLIKQGHPGAFAVFGFTANPKLSVSGFKSKVSKLKIGDAVQLPFTVQSKSKSSQKLAIDYRVHYLKKNGEHSPKVFKLSEKTLPAGEKVALNLKHRFVDNSTRKHYVGNHRLELVINGCSRGIITLDLKTKRPRR